MKTTVIACFGAMVLCVIGLACTSDMARELPKWEYKVVTGYELAEVESVWQLLESEPEESPQKHNADESRAAKDNPDLLAGLVKFESGMVAAANKKLTKGMNKLGEAGWELVTISHESSIVKRSYTFKRQQP